MKTRWKETLLRAARTPRRQSQAQGIPCRGCCRRTASRGAVATIRSSINQSRRLSSNKFSSQLPPLSCRPPCKFTFNNDPAPRRRQVSEIWTNSSKGRGVAIGREAKLSKSAICYLTQHLVGQAWQGRCWGDFAATAFGDALDNGEFLLRLCGIGIFHRLRVARLRYGLFRSVPDRCHLRVERRPGACDRGDSAASFRRARLGLAPAAPSGCSCQEHMNLRASETVKRHGH